MIYKYLSWDCAYRTLGWAIITIDTEQLTRANEIIVEIQSAAATGAVLILLAKLKAAMTKFITIEAAGVDDVLGQDVKSTSEIARIIAMRTYLENFDKLWAGKLEGITAVLIEHQPNAINLGSLAISYQIAHHYCSRYEIHFIDPKYKNKVALANNLEFSIFKPKFKHPYDARKAHTQQNCLYLLQKIQQVYVIKDIKKSILNNAADAIMQVFAFIVYGAKN